MRDSQLACWQWQVPTKAGGSWEERRGTLEELQQNLWFRWVSFTVLVGRLRKLFNMSFEAAHDPPMLSYHPARASACSSVAAACTEQGHCAEKNWTSEACCNKLSCVFDSCVIPMLVSMLHAYCHRSKRQPCWSLCRPQIQGPQKLYGKSVSSHLLKLSHDESHDGMDSVGHAFCRAMGSYWTAGSQWQSKTRLGGKGTA